MDFRIIIVAIIIIILLIGASAIILQFIQPSEKIIDTNNLDNNTNSNGLNQDSNKPIIDSDNNNLEDNNGLENKDEIVECVAIKYIDLTYKRFAIGTMQPTLESTISNRNEKTLYFHIFSDGNLVEMWNNNTPNNEEKTANVIKTLIEKNVDYLVLSNISEELKIPVKEIGLECVEATGKANNIVNMLGINEHCKPIDSDQIKQGVIAIPTTSLNQNTTVNPQGLTANYFVLYENGVKTKTLEIQNRNPNNVIELLKQNNVTQVILINSQFQDRLKINEIDCWIVKERTRIDPLFETNPIELN